MRDHDLLTSLEHSQVSVPQSMNVPDLEYCAAFLDADEAARVVRHIDAAAWLTSMRRRVQHYGFRYDYKAGRIDESMRAAPLPIWAVKMGNRLVKRGFFKIAPDQVIVNEYMPGQGIAAHVDCVPCFGDRVASVTLLSPCLMVFSEVHGAGMVDVDLAPGSAVILGGKSRYDWKHAIAARLSDRIGDVVRPRARRISATFRTVIMESSQ